MSYNYNVFLQEQLHLSSYNWALETRKEDAFDFS